VFAVKLCHFVTTMIPYRRRGN